MAVLGAGAWGQNHVRTWHELGHLVAVVDSSAETRAAIGARYPGVALLAEPDEAFAHPAVDAVVLATPAETHAELAALALAAGKDVLIEKPMTTTLAEATELHAQAEATDRVVMVGHVLEYHPAFVAIRDLLAEGTLGQLRYLYSNRLNFGRIRTEEDALWSFAPHDMALFLRLVGAMPTQVACHGGSWLSPAVADVTLMSLDFPGDVRGHVFVSWLHPFKEHRLVVIGERQMAVFDDTAPWPEKLTLYPHTVDWVDGTVPVARRAEGTAVALTPAEPLRLECQHFLECIRTRRPPLTDSATGVRVLELLDAGSRSLSQGGAPVPLGAGLA